MVEGEPAAGHEISAQDDSEQLNIPLGAAFRRYLHSTAYRQRPALERPLDIPPDKEAKYRDEERKAWLCPKLLEIEQNQLLADMLERLESTMACRSKTSSYPHQGRITPLVAAVVYEGRDFASLSGAMSESMVEELVGIYGHDINETGGGHGMTAIYVSALLGKTSCLNKLGSLGADVNISDDHGRSPAWVAADKGKADCLIACKQFKANLDKPNCFGYTPAHRAALEGHPDCLQLLIQNQCDLVQPNNAGYTPVWSAAYHGRTRCLELLIEAGCLTRLVCGPGKYNPLEIAEYHSHHACAKLLKAQAKQHWCSDSANEATVRSSANEARKLD